MRAHTPARALAAAAAAAGAKPTKDDNKQRYGTDGKIILLIIVSCTLQRTKMTMFNGFHTTQRCMHLHRVYTLCSAQCALCSCADRYTSASVLFIAMLY